MAGENNKLTCSSCGETGHDFRREAGTFSYEVFCPTANAWCAAKESMTTGDTPGPDPDEFSLSEGWRN